MISNSDQENGPCTSFAGPSYSIEGLYELVYSLYHSGQNPEKEPTKQPIPDEEELWSQWK